MARIQKSKLPEIHIDIDSHNENPDNSWILTRDRMQDIVTALDTNRMKLSAAKNYYSAYGVNVPGRTKDQFIKNLASLVNREKNPAPRKGTTRPRRKSQITGKTPSKRLVKRRLANSEPGYFPNPIDQFVKLAFKGTGGETAGIVLPHSRVVGASTSELSRYFPRSEALKMRMIYVSDAYDTWEGAFNDKPRWK